MGYHKEYHLTASPTVDMFFYKMHNFWTILLIGFIVIPAFRLTAQATIATDSPQGKSPYVFAAHI